MSFDSGAGSYRALGFYFGVRLEGSPHGLLGPAVDWLFEGLRSSREGAPEHVYRFTTIHANAVRLERDDVLVGGPVSEASALSTMTVDLNARAIASRPDHLNLHAAAVARGDKGLLLPAHSGAGKTTLTAALVIAGCHYLTDEAASVDLDCLLVEPYAKPLSLSSASQTAVGCGQSEFGPIELLPASWLQPGCWSGPVAPGSIVFPNYMPDGPAELTPITRGEALVELANNSFNFVDHGSRWLPSLRDLVAGCDCWRLTYGNALDAAALISDRVL